MTSSLISTPIRPVTVEGYSYRVTPLKIVMQGVPTVGAAACIDDRERDATVIRSICGCLHFYLRTGRLVALHPVTMSYLDEILKET